MCGWYFLLCTSRRSLSRSLADMFIAAFDYSGDTGAVRIGGNSHILDGALVAAGRGVANGHGASTHIGAYVTIGVFDMCMFPLVHDSATVWCRLLC